MGRLSLPILAPATLLVALLALNTSSAADKVKKPGRSARPATPMIAQTGTSVPNATSPLRSRIDQHISSLLQTEKVPASSLSDDAEFLRRVSLDLTGIIPTADKARAFLDSKESDKRSRLIEELLASPDFGRHLADIWQDLLLTRTSDNRRMQPAPFVKWLEERFNANKPWNQLVGELLTATGPQDENGAVTYFLANASVDKITDNVSRNFLGVQLQCAQCHNHPFTDWKQAEYWGMAAFFLKVRSGNVNRAARDGTSPGVEEVRAMPKGKQRLPESAKLVPARFLQGAEASLKPNDLARPVLASWLTKSDNPFFARAMVNRVWAQLFGRGLVNPVDDMHGDNPASHPALLQDLTVTFANGFDIKALYREICNSQAYQRSSKPVSGNEDADAQVYSRMAIKVLTPEQMYDSLTRIAGTATDDRAGARGKKTRGQSGSREQFVNFFRAEEGNDPTEYLQGIPQALRLMNSNQLNTTGLVAGFLKNADQPDRVLEEMYLTVLSRRPTTEETQRLTGYLRKGDSRQAYADILWAMLNSSEFALNR